ncbi:type II toxin-antitoxin system HicA family toxin [Xylophilus sp. Leaf220]|uniref:type II toxin-antitoxin system HicA family toxin n=1 Tax=Xylophilus sp. Leaf220 TaxID=1735686 RepID=UPI0026980AA7
MGRKVKISEFKRWLESQGVRVENGTNHWRLYLNDKISTLPRHPSKELKEGTRRAILKQLNIK